MSSLVRYKFIIPAEMMGFQCKNLYGTDKYSSIPHVYPLTNFSSINIQRGEFTSLCVEECGPWAYGEVYEPPSIELYTFFSPQTYFLALWGVLFLQSLTIFIIDKIWVKTMPENTTLWQRFMHACQKSHLPFPHTNWYKEKGGCQDHVNRKKAVDQEVLLATFVNLIFNMFLLTPLAILCKLILILTCVMNQT